MHEKRKHLVDEVKGLLQSLETRVTQLERKSPARSSPLRESTETHNLWKAGLAKPEQRGGGGGGEELYGGL